MRVKVDYQRSVSDCDDPPTVFQWCRIGIICDSNIPDVKYLLEVTPEGFIENELFSRLLIMKKEGKIIGYKPLARSNKLSGEILNNLDFIRSELRGKTWHELLALESQGNKHKEVYKIVTRATM